MSTNWLIFILFCLSWNFPNILKTGGGSALPFAFIFPSAIIFLYIIIVFITRPSIDKKIFAVICLFLFTLVFSIYSISQCIYGVEPEIPLISKSVRMQI